MSPGNDVVIIGGGPAGLTAAIDLAGRGHKVTVIEKHDYPRHKVCGEYVSNEILSYFDRLGIDAREWQPQQVTRFRLHALSGKWAQCALPLGGFGLRRFTLEARLQEVASRHGVEFLLNTEVRRVTFGDGGFRIEARGMEDRVARVVIGSFGKNSRLDRSTGRRDGPKSGRYLGAKFYLEADFPPDLVALYNIRGGYAGAVRVEDGTVDVAYLVDQRELQRHGSIGDMEKAVLHRNRALRDLILSSKPLMDRSLTIANLSFQPRTQVHEHILLVGDAAGMMPPLCGNGMAMGIHGGKLAAERVSGFLRGDIDRATMESGFGQDWDRLFQRRLRWGRLLQPVLERPLGSSIAVGGLRLIPGLLRSIIRQTHGTAIA